MFFRRRRGRRACVGRQHFQTSKEMSKKKLKLCQIFCSRLLIKHHSNNFIQRFFKVLEAVVGAWTGQSREQKQSDSSSNNIFQNSKWALLLFLVIPPVQSNECLSAIAIIRIDALQCRFFSFIAYFSADFPFIFMHFILICIRWILSLVS